MKHFSRFIITILIMGVATALPAQGDTLTILHINDTHSNLSPLGPRTATLEGTQGGIARAASVIGMTKMTDPNVLLLHAGDVFIGDLFFNCFFGVAELQLMLAMGFDAMAVGNHEFDLTPAALQQALDSSFVEGSFPLLSANLILEDQDVSGLKEYIFPFTVKEFDSIKVGIFGLTTPETNFLSQPAPAIIDENFVEAAGAMVDTLTKLECDVIICLSHLGFYYDQVVVSYVPGIDIIVGGHDHFIFDEPFEATDPLGNTTYIVQADAFYSSMGKAQLLVENGEVSLLDNYTIIPLDENIPEEPTTKATVEYLISEIEATYGPVYTQQVGYCDGFFEEYADSLTSFGPHDTPIGNLVTDAYRSTFGTDIAIQAGGSTAQPLYEGPIVGADLFRVVGYGFNTDNGLGYRMATFNISGAALIAGLQFGVSGIEEVGDEYLIQVSGMRYMYDIENDFLLNLEETYVGDELIAEDSVYSVAANEFVPMFLDYLGIPYADLHVYSDTTEFQVLSAYVAQYDTLTPLVEGRINDWWGSVDFNDPLPVDFTLDQNYPNPFNPTTRIPFTLAKTSFIELQIYDITGRKVKLIHSGMLPAGQHNLVWDGTNVSGTNVASGIYFYRLISGFKNETRRMVLMR